MPRAPVTAQAALSRYHNALRGSSRRATYIRTVERWYAYGRAGLAAGDRPTAADVRRYVERRRADGRQDTTIDWELRAVRSCYARWRLKLPPPTDLQMHSRRVALDADLIAHLVDCAIVGRYPPLTRGYLAVATLYGARVGEMRRLHTQRVDLAGRRIHIPTLKHGVRRWQRIPETAAWALHAPWRICPPGQAGGRFHAMLERARVPDLQGVGWHSIRRSLATAFAGTTLPQERWARFMRWRITESRGAGRNGEAELYSHPTVTVGMEGTDRGREDDGVAQDDDVWAAHPFADLWDR